MMVYRKDDIYDGGSNISNATAVSRMRSLFEAPAPDPKPFKPVPKKIMRPIPGSRAPTTQFPKADKPDGTTANGDISTNKGSENPSETKSNVPPWKARVNQFKNIPPTPPSTFPKPVNSVASSRSMEERKDENSNTVQTGKQTSKLNIPSAFSGDNNGPPPIISKKPVISPTACNESIDKRDATSPDDASPPRQSKPNVPVRIKSPGSGSLQDELSRKFCGKEAELTPVKSKFGDGPKQPVKQVGKLNLDMQKKFNQRSSEESVETVPMRPKTQSLSKFQNRKSVKRKSFTRTNDGSKFFLVEISMDDKVGDSKDREPDIPPPLVYANIHRLHEIIQEYKSALGEMEGSSRSADDDGVIEDIEDMYEAIPADELDGPPEPPPKKKLSRAVSMIQPMTEEEEFDQEDYEDVSNTLITSAKPLPAPPDLALPPPPEELLKPAVPDMPIPARKKPPSPVLEKKVAIVAETLLIPQTDDWPDDTYDDCTTKPVLNQDPTEAEADEVYEAIAGEAENTELTTPAEKSEDKKEEKLTAKEKKKREKEEQDRKKAEKKKQDAEKKRQEKEMKDLKKNFKIEAFELDTSQGEGLLKEDAVPSGGKLSKLELTAKKGAFLKVIRLVENPPGKWLVRLTEDTDQFTSLSQIVGYVEASIVEVDNELIRNMIDDKENSIQAPVQVMAGSYATALNNIDNDHEEEYQDVEGVVPVAEDIYEDV